MVAIFDKSSSVSSMTATNGGIIVKNKDARSESVDSFSSTVDVNDYAPPPSSFKSKQHHGDANSNADDADASYRCRSIITSLDSSSPSDDDARVRTLLDAYDGHLLDVGTHLLEGLRSAAPSRLAARVGDCNENLFYEMRDCDMGIDSIIRSGRDDNHDDDDVFDDSPIRKDIRSFETSLRTSLRSERGVSYRGSFMRTERTMYQPAHVDYDYPVLRSYGSRLFLAFFPLTEEGAYLQLWQDPASGGGGGGSSSGSSRRSRSRAGKGDDGDDDDDDDDDDEPVGEVVEGTVVYIPYGKMLMVPSDTIHGGGFKRGDGGNLRFHLYIAVEDDNDHYRAKEGGDEGEEERKEEIMLLDHPMNKYTEEHDKRRELCERFVDAKGLDGLLGTFFDV